MSKVLIVSHEVIGKEMAGPGVRYWEIARVLSGSHTVILVSPNETSLEPTGFSVRCYGAHNILQLAKEVDVILVSGLVLALKPALGRLKVPIVVDLYIPNKVSGIIRTLHTTWYRFGYTDPLQIYCKTMEAVYIFDSI